MLRHELATRSVGSRLGLLCKIIDRPSPDISSGTERPKGMRVWPADHHVNHMGPRDIAGTEETSMDGSPGSAEGKAATARG